MGLWGHTARFTYRNSPFKFIYFSHAGLGPCAQASLAVPGLSLVAVLGLLLAVSSLVAEHGL